MLLQVAEEESPQPQRTSAGRAHPCWVGSAGSATAEEPGCLLSLEPWVEGSWAGGGPVAAITSMLSSGSIQRDPTYTGWNPAYLMSGMPGNGINPAIGREHRKPQTTQVLSRIEGTKIPSKKLGILHITGGGGK